MIDDASDGIVDVFHSNGRFQVGDLNLHPADIMTDRPPGSDHLFKSSVDLLSTFRGTFQLNHKIERKITSDRTGGWPLTTDAIGRVPLVSCSRVPRKLFTYKAVHTYE